MSCGSHLVRHAVASLLFRWEYISIIRNVGHGIVACVLCPKILHSVTYLCVILYFPIKCYSCITYTVVFQQHCGSLVTRVGNILSMG
jgi:hypothetical protein